jgi:hypothetical protein
MSLILVHIGSKSHLLCVKSKSHHLDFSKSNQLYKRIWVQVTSCMPCHNLHFYMSAFVLLCLRIMVPLSAIIVEAVIHTQWVVRTFSMSHPTILTHSGHFIHSIVSCVCFWLCKFLSYVVIFRNTTSAYNEHHLCVIEVTCFIKV